MNESTESQCQEVLKALKRGERLTAITALRDFGCFRLAARIKDLRNQGHPIVSQMFFSNGKRFAVYSWDGWFEKNGQGVMFR